jgi:archaellum component FlaG (FlaF/FlaG flagellin family)
VFTITVPREFDGNINVTVGVANMGQIASMFDALEINVMLKDSSDNLVDQDFISLQGGISTVVLGARVSGGASGTTYTVAVTISGKVAKSASSSSVDIIMYCSVRPAEAVQT